MTPLFVIPDLIWDRYRILRRRRREILKQVQDDIGGIQDDTLICHPRLDLHKALVIPDLIWDRYRMLRGCLWEILKQVQDDVRGIQDDTLICHPRLDLGSLSDATQVPVGDPETSSG